MRWKCGWCDLPVCIYNTVNIQTTKKYLSNEEHQICENYRRTRRSLSHWQRNETQHLCQTLKTTIEIEAINTENFKYSGTSASSLRAARFTSRQRQPRRLMSIQFEESSRIYKSQFQIFVCLNGWTLKLSQCHLALRQSGKGLEKKTVMGTIQHSVF